MGSIIILLILIIGAVVSQLTKSKRKTWIGMKTTRLLLLGYGGLLILLGGASVILPMNNSSLKMLSEEEIEQTLKLQDEIINQAYRGTFKAEDGIDAVKKWTYQFKEEELIITPINSHSVQVFIEKSPDIKEEIEVIHYVGKTVVNGFDITEKRGAVELDLSSNVLEIKNPPQVAVKLAEVSNGFPFQQFSKEKVELYPSDSFGNIGMDVLYIKAPVGLKIDGQALYVN
jgi:hypothetical protein